MKPVQKKNYPRVAICVDRGQGYGNTLLKGIARYVETYGPWSLFIDTKFLGDFAQSWLRNWKGDGVLAYVEDIRLAKVLRDSGIPTVEMFGHRYDLGLPQVCPDGYMVGQLGAQHLLERKFRNFTFCGYLDMPWSDTRQRGFSDALKNAGFSCDVHLLRRHQNILAQWNRMQQQLGKWLRSLPRPNGLMAISDRHAQRILDACHRENISVPEEIAIVGASNDEEFCRLANPPITSVMFDVERIGYESAALLDRMMKGKSIKPKTVFIPPLGIITRRSTDVTAIDDHLVADAMRFIREHACDGIGVEQLLAQFKISRTHFYRRFQKQIKRPPHEEILRVKLERAKSLLTQTDLAIERIAEMSGFQNTEYLYVVFRRALGMTPRAYRKQ